MTTTLLRHSQTSGGTLAALACALMASAGEKKKRMSKDCEIKVRNMGKSVVEVSLIGKGEPVGKVTQALPKGELLVTGGNAENFTAWFVVLKQVD